MCLALLRGNTPSSLDSKFLESAERWRFTGAAAPLHARIPLLPSRMNYTRLFRPRYLRRRVQGPSE